MPRASKPFAESLRASDARLLFWGTPAFAVPALHALVRAGFRPRAVITQPDRPVGRSPSPIPPPIKQEAQTMGIAMLQPISLRDQGFLDELRAQQPDIFIVCAYGKILPGSVLALPRRGALNVHPSLLPRHRGAAPIQQAILDGDAETGVTIYRMDRQMDHGPTVAQERVPLSGTEIAPQLSSALARLGADLLTRTLPAYLAGSLSPIPQDERAATVTQPLTRDAGRIDWTSDARRIERMLRAYTPWPGAWTVWNGKRIKILAAAVREHRPAAHLPGTVFQKSGAMCIACGQDVLELQKLQLEGGLPMDVLSFLRGHPDFLGAKLSEGRRHFSVA